MGHIERPRRAVRPDTATGAAPALGGGTRRGSAPVTAGAPLGIRPPPLLHAVRRLDAGLADEALRETAAWLREHYTNAYGTAPLGYVAPCFLGPPYADHLLGLDGCVLEHYAPADPMPAPFPAARMLARSGAYAYVEVYEGGLVLPVLADGTVVRP
ncbi:MULTISPECIES: hypothetical protein [Streptomyces]|uniref:hypothetical protein n=1 Tax=Streptomyces TaxID=1883 RepID=UPI0029A1AF65|nr:hypothetical protein [Streptomyces sp. ND04-05B]MDX3062802.1 hypothetical protein [Streptomyces sp. ND04-05B]